MLFTRRDHDRLATILREAAQREVIPRFRALGKDGVRQKKSAIDVVTDADEQAERRICAELAAAFPGALLIGEEAMAADERLLAKLPEAELAFVIDPVDGTLNFASDLPLFAVMAAVLIRGEVVAAVIHDPNVDDTAMALRGEGAWLEFASGERRDLRVATPGPLHDMTGMVSWKYFNEPQRRQIPGAFSQFADVSSLRCCGQEYRLAAAGHCHFLMYGRLNPWDHAPGSLLYAEAGGHARLLHDAPYRAGAVANGLLCAPDRESWQAIRGAFFGQR
ncbi:MAG: inositol monophosphatase [Hyphomicrobiales bacterium]|nr:inositol monophosphatase [Hyphomicrobiales bacterium]